MKKLFICLVAAILFAGSSCDRKPFVEHKIRFEKMEARCAARSSDFRMLSNFGGERFEFQKCLPADFTKEQMTTSRSGDTVVVQFKQPPDLNAGALFRITLDIDSYPRYNYITIDDETYAIIPAN